MTNGSDQSRIFLYEDDAALAQEIMAAFARDGREVRRIACEAELRAVADCKGCVLIMDRMVDNCDSIAIVQRLRSEGSLTPVIVISSLASIDERIKGLKAGGDDYLTKPFAMGELIARVESLLRRLPDDRETVLRVGNLVMDVIDRSVARGGRTIILSPREFSLLEYFMRRPDQVITRAMILEAVWKYKGPIDTNIVDVHMSNLRRKIDAEGEPSLIGRQRGIGFVLTAAVS